MHEVVPASLPGLSLRGASSSVDRGVHAGAQRPLRSAGCHLCRGCWWWATIFLRRWCAAEPDPPTLLTIQRRTPVDRYGHSRRVERVGDEEPVPGIFVCELLQQRVVLWSPNMIVTARPRARCCRRASAALDEGNLKRRAPPHVAYRKQ